MSNNYNNQPHENFQEEGDDDDDDGAKNENTRFWAKVQAKA